MSGHDTPLLLLSEGGEQWINNTKELRVALRGACCTLVVKLIILLRQKHHYRLYYKGDVVPPAIKTSLLYK